MSRRAVLAALKRHNVIQFAALLLIGAMDACTANLTSVPLDVATQAAPVFSVYTSKDGLSDEIWSTVGSDRRGQACRGTAR